MSQITIYTQTFCPFCDRAKKLLKEKNIDFEEINLDGKTEELLKLKEKTGLRTIPQIFIDDELIGGFSELAEMEASGKLSEKMRS